MRIIKLILISFIVFFGILTGFSLFIPSHIRMSKVINLKADKDSIFSLLKNKEQWPRWHPAFSAIRDPEHKYLQQTNITILSQSDTTLEIQMQQSEKKKLLTGWQLHNYSTTDSSTLEWHTDFHLAWYPWQKFSSLFFEKTYGTMMERGLYNIREELEEEKERRENGQ